MTSQQRVAVLGTGAIGTAVARRFLAAGVDTVVWNRTPSRAAPLVAAGAHHAATATEAVSSSTLALLTVTDHAAAAEILTGVPTDPGQTVVVMCTGIPGNLPRHFLTAGIQASPAVIGTPAATFVYSGSRPAYDRGLPLLQLLGTARFAGESPEAAAIWDLALFGLWYDAHLGLLRALETIRATGGDLTAFSEAATTQLGHVVAGVASALTEPGPATLTEHLTVLRELITLRAGHPLGDGGLTTIAARLESLPPDLLSGKNLNALISR
ncbi:NAD(P)-binding domain-containing protein [Actinoplanes sp. NPDC051861]|uniref:NAD(P)-binding domain-containing protein n=1 Tax=Actinoplanes sp. NPDC051861 TaxID=3155170 RepID=UPI003417FB6A